MQGKHVLEIWFTKDKVLENPQTFIWKKKEKSSEQQLAQTWRQGVAHGIDTCKEYHKIQNHF